MAEHTNLLSARKLCKSGSHQWGEWKYVAENSCTEEAICVRCNGTRLRANTHKWDAWEYMSENLCSQKRSCPRCNEEASQILHVWSEWEYVSENHCGQKKSCLRCNIDYSDTHVEHVWVLGRTEEEVMQGLSKGPGQSYDAELFESETTWTTIYNECSRCKEEKVAKTYHSTVRID